MKLFLGSLLFLFSHYINGQTPTFITTDKATHDIEKMITTFEEIHYEPYFNTTKKQFNQSKKQLLNNWEQDSITLKKFMTTGMKLAALLSGGHSYMDWKNPRIIPEIKSYYYIPFTGMMINDNQTFVVTRSNNSEIRTGMHIQSINGINIGDLFEECMSYIGGINEFRNVSCEKIFPLYLFFNDELRSPYSIKSYQSETTIETKGLTISELITFINAVQVQEDYSFEILESEIGLISYNNCNGYKTFKRFLKKAFKTLKQKNINKLIIDIRENGGGDSGLNDLLLSYITKLPYRQSSGRYWKVSEQAKNIYAANPAYIRLFGEKFMNQYMNTPNQEIIESLDGELVYPITPKNYFNGKTCLLIGPNTFSSANFLADAVKTYTIATLIGTPTGEYTNDFGEQLSFTLPNSRSTVYISSTFDIGANGNDSIFEPVYPDVEVKIEVLKYAINWILLK